MQLKDVCVIIYAAFNVSLWKRVKYTDLSFIKGGFYQLLM